MYYNLFLDDERSPLQVTWINLPPCEWIVIRNYEEFVKCITNRGIPVRVSFDHDLAIEHYPIFEVDCVKNSTTIPYESYSEKTGYHCAKWLVEYCLANKVPLPECFIHTMNPIGRSNIDSVLKSFQSYTTKYE